ncbi:MAG: NAD(P)H-dependent oxidoreductase [Bdellovibrionaceae bacterium]|nr:NAD(P)H-dependent oxidoreductase [Pseudobdellovibrionaceae bacterium]
MKNILFLAAHPHLSQSRANKTVIQAVRDVPGVRLHPLYDLYPYFHINVPHEQSLLAEADLLVIQHPLYWYNMPSLLKLWLDEVLEFNWAYGPEGKMLQGKDLLVSITSGGPMEDSFPAWEQTARTCGMNFHPPFLLPWTTDVSDEDLHQHAQSVRTALMTYANEGRLP